MWGCHFFCTFGGMKKGLLLLGMVLLRLAALAQEPLIINNVPVGTGYRIEVDGHVVAFSDEGWLGERVGCDSVVTNGTVVVTADALPPVMQEWLGQMTYEAKMLCEGRAQAHRTPRRAEYIAPMVTTRWGQRLPFNLMAPEYDEGAHCATGCVATAMAQILKYWSAPIETAEVPGYTTETLGLQLEALPPTMFDYDMMHDDYEDIFDHSESAYAVAKLMRYCGQAAEMDYDINSGAYTIGRYLAQYFGFSSDYEDKDHITHLIDWDELIYDELAAGRPVLYSGKKLTGSGHVFVVDGYQDGYFHINWGWNGNSNGFFKLTLANPDDPDSAYLWEGYRWAQRAVIGLQPGPNATGVTEKREEQLGMRNEVWHDLQGRRVKQPSAPGMYIRNGRIVVVK